MATIARPYRLKKSVKRTRLSPEQSNVARGPVQGEVSAIRVLPDSLHERGRGRLYPQQLKYAYLIFRYHKMSQEQR